MPINITGKQFLGLEKTVHKDVTRLCIIGKADTFDGLIINEEIKDAHFSAQTNIFLINKNTIRAFRNRYFPYFLMEDKENGKR